ncbi:MAG: hypothetical protein M1834_007690 [Cirrosporium novae-zelandiae]|nr:MAG: hypothetical protein M1834_007690 [Cirrosporium novae-zelandiae]
MSSGNRSNTDSERKRSRSKSPPPWRRPQKIPRRSGPFRDEYQARSSGNRPDERKNYNSFANEQKRLNQLQEAEQMREWVAQEDHFVLKQAKKKAEIRVKEGRAKPIDWLAVTLRVIDPTRDPTDDEISDSDLDIVDPEGVLEDLAETQILDLEKDIDTYLKLEVNKNNHDFWATMKVICQDRLEKFHKSGPEGRAVNSVSADINRLLAPKKYEELMVLEKQVTAKLRSDGPIDVDYWEQLLRSLNVWKARAKLRKVYQSIIDSRLEALRDQQKEEAFIVREKLSTILTKPVTQEDEITGSVAADANANRPGAKVRYSRELDPEPLLKIRSEDKGLEIIDEKAFLDRISSERQKIRKLGYVPTRQLQGERPSEVIPLRNLNPTKPLTANDDFSQATKALYEREVARGVSENEEIFAGEEEVQTQSKPLWANKHRPRKPRYFNRVQMGYEWNKYNQTHYDHDNPPPKVVQGYKFNIFYPDLIDKTKAPTYRIERENGRKRGQSFAPAGEEDTCLIRFMSGPPYEDIAFRIVDKEWDYSAKRERGFKSSFDKGILQLHFQFKKIYYRK